MVGTMRQSSLPSLCRATRSLALPPSPVMVIRVVPRRRIMRAVVVTRRRFDHNDDRLMIRHRPRRIDRVSRGLLDGSGQNQAGAEYGGHQQFFPNASGDTGVCTLFHGYLLFVICCTFSFHHRLALSCWPQPVYSERRARCAFFYLSYWKYMLFCCGITRCQYLVALNFHFFPATIPVIG